MYKISKVLIDVEEFHGQTERGVKQELFAHFTLITLNRIFANQAEGNLINIDNCLEQKNDSKISNLLTKIEGCQ